MFGNRFYNSTTRKYISMFGTLFNDIRIYRRENDGTLKQTITVPIAYGPMQKFLARIQQDPNLDAPAIQLPRMSFEIMNMAYDGTRKLTNSFKQKATIDTDDGQYRTTLTPAPYNIDIQLSVMTKYMEDGTKIIEQILPFFQPNFTPSVKLIDDPEYYLDVDVVLNDITMEDTYESDFQERRALIWTLNFTIKGWYFGPTTDKKVIKFVEVNEYESLDASNASFTMTVQPGLDANGNPTTDPDVTVDYANVSIDDNWTYLVQIEDNT